MTITKGLRNYLTRPNHTPRNKLTTQSYRLAEPNIALGADVFRGRCGLRDYAL